MKNAVEGVNTFYAMREAGRVAREKERGPRPDAEELTRRTLAAAHRNMNTNQIESRQRRVALAEFPAGPAL